MARPGRRGPHRRRTERAGPVVELNGDAAALCLRRDQVEIAVAVEIRRRREDGDRVDVQIDGDAEAAEAVAEEHLLTARAGWRVGDDQIAEAVAIQVADLPDPADRGERRSMVMAKPPVPSPSRMLSVPAPMLRGRDVRTAVVVEVVDDQAVRPGADGESDRRRRTCRRRCPASRRSASRQCCVPPKTRSRLPSRSKSAATPWNFGAPTVDWTGGAEAAEAVAEEDRGRASRMPDADTMSACPSLLKSADGDGLRRRRAWSGTPAAAKPPAPSPNSTEIVDVGGGRERPDPRVPSSLKSRLLDLERRQLARAGRKGRRARRSTDSRTANDTVVAVVSAALLVTTGSGLIGRRRGRR